MDEISKINTAIKRTLMYEADSYGTMLFKKLTRNVNDFLLVQTLVFTSPNCFCENSETSNQGNHEDNICPGFKCWAQWNIIHYHNKPFQIKYIHKLLLQLAPHTKGGHFLWSYVELKLPIVLKVLSSNQPFLNFISTLAWSILSARFVGGGGG